MERAALPQNYAAIAVFEHRDTNKGCIGCTDVTASGSAVLQKAHSAMDRPTYQLLFAQAGQ